MKITPRIIMVILKAKYKEVADLGHGLYLVQHSDNYVHWWGIYSSRVKNVVCSGDKYTVLSPDLVSFETCRSRSESLFSLSRHNVVTFGEYRGYCFESHGADWVWGLFLKDERGDDIRQSIGGTGIYDISKTNFVVQPEFYSLIKLEHGLYYGTKVERNTNQQTFYLIRISEKGESEAKKIPKIA